MYCLNVLNILFSEILLGVKNFSVCVKGKFVRIFYVCNFFYYWDVDIFFFDLLCRVV